VRETHAMDRWIALGIFLLGAGVGALTTVALYAGQIRHLKELPKAVSHDDSPIVSYNNLPDEKGEKSDRRKSA
jgi:hypothetical protein